MQLRSAIRPVSLHRSPSGGTGDFPFLAVGKREPGTPSAGAEDGDAADVAYDDDGALLGQESGIGRRSDHHRYFFFVGAGRRNLRKLVHSTPNSFCLDAESTRATESN